MKSAHTTLRNVVVVVTGASSGIGKATALAFAREGAKVVLAARRQAPLEQAAAECSMAGGQGKAIVTDVTDEQSVGNLTAPPADMGWPLPGWRRGAARR